MLTRRGRMCESASRAASIPVIVLTEAEIDLA
jgi:hypothetical protein